MDDERIERLRVRIKGQTRVTLLWVLATGHLIRKIGLELLQAA